MIDTGDHEDMLERRLLHVNRLVCYCCLLVSMFVCFVCFFVLIVSLFVRACLGIPMLD